MKGVLICFLVVTFLLAGYSLGRGQETILKIDVAGNERIDRGVVVAAVKTKEKEAYDPEKIREDIKTIYKTGFFNIICSQGYYAMCIYQLNQLVPILNPADQPG